MRIRASRQIGILLIALAVLLVSASSARAVPCSAYGGVLDGFAGTPPPSRLQIDQNCTIKNYPASNPFTSNISFYTQPGQNQQRWLVIFDNVVHTGQMSCNSVLQHKIWFVNGSSSSIQNGCQNLLIPVEKIDKQNPAGQTTVTVGVPFTYTLTIPVLYDPGTGNVINGSGSLNDLHSVVLTDDLNATGVDLTYVSHVAYWKSSGAPVPHTFSNVGGLLTFSDFPIIPAGEQIIIEVTVVLEDTPTNSVGTQFINTAKWVFGRLIDGVFYEPLPGESGITPPLTIAAPELTVTKTGPATLGLTLNLGQYGQFALDVQNTGLSDAWNVTLLDRLPDGPTGGMCDTAPEVLSAQVFQSDGTTAVSGPLVQGVDFSFTYSSAPTCELTLTTLTPAAVIHPSERLIITYRTKLDPNSQDGAMLTNVAGATRWYNGDISNPERLTYTRTLTDGTPGTLDYQDAHTVTVALFGYFFEKSVQDLTSGINPSPTAAPGDVLRYTLRLQTTDVPLSGLRFYDELGRLNSSQVFVPGSLAIVPASLPPGADASNTDPNGGPNGAGILDVRNLDVPANSQVEIQFDITVDPNLNVGDVILNQSDLFSGGIDIARSDDPNINGQSDPSVAGDEDPTRVVIATLPTGPLLKQTTQTTATIGESFTYQITVPATPYPFDLYDVRITDDLAASGADLRFLSVRKISGSQPWVPVNTGSDTNLVIEDTTNGIDIPANEQIVVEITVVVADTARNTANGVFANTASFLHNAIDNDDTSTLPGEPGTSSPITIVEPDLTMTKGGPTTMSVGTPETFSLDVQNVGQSPAWFATLTDQLPDGATGGTCDLAPTVLTAQVFQANGTTPVSAPLVAGTDFTTTFTGTPSCLLTISITSAAGAIGPTERLIVTYQTELDVDTQNGVALTNVAGATEWYSTDGLDPLTLSDRRHYRRTLTDGTVGVLDHEDAHTVVAALQAYLFEKTVADVTTGADPATTARPGDRLHYRLRVENLSAIPLTDFSLRDELGRLNPAVVFQPGTLQLTTVPPGADTSGTSSTGGADGTGLVDVAGLSLPGMNDVVIVEYEVVLASSIANGTLVTDQAQLLVNGVPFADSDDPNVNGPADPFVAGDEDPTRVQIQSSPQFLVQKVSSDLTGDPAVLLPGDTLRYVITVKNVGNEDVVDAQLRDAIPANTTYVAGSTTLNGAPVPDAPSGSPLDAGLLISAPENPTPGAMRADASATTTNVATLVFDVVVDPGVVDGTVISNQAFVSGAAEGVVDQPSDDPATPLVNDPTRDVVGSTPLLFATKSVALQVDGLTPGIVDPGDTLRYTITVYNTGSVPATGVVLTDAVPANAIYVANSTTLNTLPVGQPDGGTSPLASGIPISSSDLTPPLPGLGMGTLDPGQTAVLVYDLQVDPAALPGTVISNQAVVSTVELPNLLTDGDGNPATGPEPTVVVVGNGQQLAIAKQVVVVGGGAALPGSTLEYTVRVTNIASVPAYSVVLSDDIDPTNNGYLTYVAPSATMNGSTSGVTVAGSLITADYDTTYGPLAPGGVVVLRFRATLSATLAIGTPVTNTGTVTWNNPPQTASASVSFDVGGVPGFGVIDGTVWHDADFDDTIGSGELLLQGWTVELLRNGQLAQSVTTDAAGAYRIAGLQPNDTNGDVYTVRFTAPGAGINTAKLGLASSPFTNSLQEITNIAVTSGAVLQNLDLPIDPNGVVYDAVQRTPIAGATLTMLSGPGGTALPTTCFDDAAQQGQVTRADGYYKFDLNFSDAACPSGGDYVIAVTAPGTGYVAGTSAIIPPSSDPSTTALSVPSCPGTSNDALASPPGYCEAQPLPTAPPPSVLPRDPATAYYLYLVLDASQTPGSSQIFNNHIPLDPVLDDAVAITKTAAKVNVSRGDLVPYEITFSNQLGVDFPDLSIVDTFPAGFVYVKGSAELDGNAAEPTITGRQLTWTNVGLGTTERRRLVLLLTVGAGVSEGKFVNRAQAISSLTGTPLSGVAMATVRVVPDPTLSCTDVLGKVFEDTNRNGVQDHGEHGLQGVRLVTARGLIATTDRYGRFHITCPIVPRDGRGSNFVLKLDDRSLPTGYRLSTRQTQVKRATRGKALRFAFGASIYRVVSLDVANDVFEPGSTEMRMQWRPRIGLLLDELAKGRSVLRLSYVADVEDEGLVERRLDALEKQISQAWEERHLYPLSVEREVFWRRGAPPAHRGGLRSLLPWNAPADRGND